VEAAPHPDPVHLVTHTTENHTQDPETLFDRARDGVAVLTPGWRIRYANASLLEILGLIGGSPSVERLWDALPGWEHTPEADLLRDSMERRTPAAFRIGRDRGGGRAWDVTTQPLPDGDLRVRLHNVTADAEREEVEARAREARDAYTAALERERSALFEILDTLPVGVAVAQAETGEIVYLNPAGVELGGRSREVLSAREVGEYTRRWNVFRPTGEPYPPEELPLARALGGETVAETEVVVRHPDGTERTLLVSGVPLRDAGGHVERGIIAFYDISERLVLERELVERTADAEHAAADASMRAEESRALREMGRALVSSLEPEHVLGLAGQNAMELLGARGSFVSIPAPDGESMRLSPALGLMAEMDGTAYPVAGSAAKLVLDHGTRLYNSMEDVPAGSSLLPAIRRMGVRNLLLVPMRAFGETLGVLGVVDRSGGFGAEDARLLEAFADSAALAVHNARLYAGERRRAEVNRALLRAAEVLTSTLDPDEVMERIVVLAEELIGADGAGLSLLVGEAGEEAWMAVASGLLEETRDVRRPAAGSLTEAALRRGRPSVFPVAKAAGHPSAAGLRRLGVGDYAVAPLLAGEEKLGVLGLVRREGKAPFSTEEMRTLAVLGTQAALAVRNARLYGEAQQASRAKSDFLAMMSHELRTPLNALEGYAGLLADDIYGPLNDGQRAALGRMRAAQRHLVQLIDQVLDVARVEAGMRRARMEPVPMAALVREICEALRGAAEGRGLALTVDAEEVGSVRTDAGMVRQVLANLLGNAVKFTATGGVSVRLRREAAEAVLLEVSDTGPGIAPELRERIFEPFFQVDPSTTRAQGGVGLGLALSREYARLLGGELTVRSRPGEGSTFSLRLPRGAPAEG
jgi:PAS domain S-box-containing protein